MGARLPGGHVQRGLVPGLPPRGWHGLSLVADQQITAGVMWAVASACFVPVIFFNLFQWLHGEEDPDEALQRLVREERRRGAPCRGRSA